MRLLLYDVRQILDKLQKIRFSDEASRMNLDVCWCEDVVCKFCKTALEDCRRNACWLRSRLGVDVKLCKHGYRVRLSAVNPERACLGRREC